MLNEQVMNIAANLLSENTELAGVPNLSDDDLKYLEDCGNRIARQRMLKEDIDKDPSFDEILKQLTYTRDIWLKELQASLPENYHAEAYTGSCATGLSRKIPGINITHDVKSEPGKYMLVNDQNPRKIEFEGVGPCTTNGYEKNVAIHYPGVRRMATRFTLPTMYNVKKTIANIVKDITG